MKINQVQFEVLVRIQKAPSAKHSQRNIANALGVSLGMVNKAINELCKEQAISLVSSSVYRMNDIGVELLRPYKVKRALFMAAGFGSRMVPLTLNTPKPLIKVHGKRMIDTLLDAVIAAGINEIYIVRGYLGEQFDVLLKQYPMIKFIDNPIFNETNNISSALLLKDLFCNAYVLESDLVLYNPDIIRAYEYTSNYLGMKVDRCDDWCFQSKKGIITKVQIGGNDVHHMFGISYWDEVAGKQLKKDVEKIFNAPGGKEKYWDEVALKECINNYEVYVREISKNQIVEIDTYNELKQIDSAYDV